MNRKRLDYLETGVQEYLVLCVEEQELFWFHFPSRQKLKPDRKGIWKSRIFPGLWLDGPALLARDSARLIATANAAWPRPSTPHSCNGSRPPGVRSAEGWSRRPHPVS